MIPSEVFGPLDAVFVDNISAMLTRELRQKIAEKFKKWLAEDARKKPVPDLPDRIAGMSKRFDALALELRIEMESNEPVVKASGNTADTLRMLQVGTAWFDPCQSVLGLVISAIWKT